MKLHAYVKSKQIVREVQKNPENLAYICSS